eukprot:1991657-Prymnesium_polylepis.1
MAREEVHSITFLAGRPTNDVRTFPWTTCVVVAALLASAAYVLLRGDDGETSGKAWTKLVSESAELVTRSRHPGVVDVGCVVLQDGFRQSRSRFHLLISGGGYLFRLLISAAGCISRRLNNPTAYFALDPSESTSRGTAKGVGLSKDALHVQVPDDEHDKSARKVPFSKTLDAFHHGSASCVSLGRPNITVSNRDPFVAVPLVRLGPADQEAEVQVTLVDMSARFGADYSGWHEADNSMLPNADDKRSAVVRFEPHERLAVAHVKLLRSTVNVDHMGSSRLK